MGISPLAIASCLSFHSRTFSAMAVKQNHTSFVCVDALRPSQQLYGQAGIFSCLFVCVDALQPSQQLFGQAGMISCLPGVNQYVSSR